MADTARWMTARDAARELSTLVHGARAARLRLGQMLIELHNDTPRGEFRHMLDQYGIHRATAYRALKDAGFTGLSHAEARENDETLQTSGATGAAGALSHAGLSHGEAHGNGETMQTSGATGAGGADQPAEEAWWDSPQGLKSEEEDEDDEDEGRDEWGVGSGEERTEDSGLRTQDPAFGIRHSALGAALSTQNSALPGASGAQLTLDALYLAAQRAHAAVVGAAARLLERVRDGDRAAAVELDRLASLSSVAQVSPGD